MTLLSSCPLPAAPSLPEEVRTVHRTDAADCSPASGTWPDRGPATSVTRIAFNAAPSGPGDDVASSAPWPTAIAGELPGYSCPTTLLPREPAGMPVGTSRPVGGYRLLEPLGAGAQAVVRRAVQGRPGGRLVALKLLAIGPRGDSRRVARLRREAARCARLEHPSILPVYEYGEADGVAFLAMELVDGRSLAEVIARRRRPGAGGQDGGHRLESLPEAEYMRAVAAVLSQVAHALHAAHAGRVAHRDVKPANILLGRRPGARAFLADFGLGRDLDEATADQLLRDGSGTPMYMAPEKLRGRPADEVLCDVYALGVT